MCTHIMCRNHIYPYTNKHGTLFTYERLRCLSDLISIQCDISKSAYLSTILLQQHDAHTLYATNTTTSHQANCHPRVLLASHDTSARQLQPIATSLLNLRFISPPSIKPLWAGREITVNKVAYPSNENVMNGFIQLC